MRSHTLARCFALLATLTFAASTAQATPVQYELVVLLGGDELLISSGGPTFDDATFTPGGVVAATDFDFSHSFSLDPPATFSFAGCTSLNGHVNAGGTDVVALSGTCDEDDGSTEGILTFFSDNTMTVELPAALILLNATYTLVPEPGVAWMALSVLAFGGALRRRG
jgi:hypothetical protein